mmetsp:Transcript_30720/g.97847  ORF Transcript_30720/g.97847 Transcript_30720/m.97847 type:complete len:102 (-) Transcript_30720:193-498(-)
MQAAFLDYEFLTFEQTDWKPLRKGYMNLALGQLLGFNAVVGDSYPKMACYDGTQCTFPWETALTARDVVKTGSWYNVPETRTAIAMDSLFEEMGLNEDGKN